MPSNMLLLKATAENIYMNLFVFFLFYLLLYKNKKGSKKQLKELCPGIFHNSFVHEGQ